VYESNPQGTGEVNNARTVHVASGDAVKYADLEVADLVVDAPDGIASGKTVTVRWKDKNSGAAGVTRRVVRPHPHREPDDRREPARHLPVRGRRRRRAARGRRGV
jgi:hypothetical protein